MQMPARRASAGLGGLNAPGRTHPDRSRTNRWANRPNQLDRIRNEVQRPQGHVCNMPDEARAVPIAGFPSVRRSVRHAVTR